MPLRIYLLTHPNAVRNRRYKSQKCLSIEGGPTVNVCIWLQSYILLFALMTLTLTLWPWYRKLTLAFQRRTHLPKINFLGRGFQKLQHKQDRHQWRFWDSQFGGAVGAMVLVEGIQSEQLQVSYYTNYTMQVFGLVPRVKLVEKTHKTCMLKSLYASVRILKWHK